MSSRFTHESATPPGALRRLSLNHPFANVRRPPAGVAEQDAPLLSRPFPAARYHEHQQVEPLRAVRRVSRLDHSVEHDQPLAGRGTDRPQDPLCRVVVPVVENRREEMEVAARDRLEEAPLHKPTTVTQLRARRLLVDHCDTLDWPI